MNRPRINLGADDRILAMMFVVFLIAGCIAQTDDTKKTKTTKPKHPSQQTLSDKAFESFQNRDLMRAELLLKAADEIDAGTLKYDKPCMDRMAEIGAQSSLKTWTPTAENAQEIMGTGDKWEPSKASKVFRDIAAGSRKAGGK